jgi:hypothetical protein
VNPILGPAVCHDCHAPQLYLTSLNPPRWAERQWQRVRGDLVPVLRVHACTGRKPLPLPGVVR